jgi:hypothetical protein
MQGYSTGWKFNGWWSEDGPLSGAANSVFVNEDTGETSDGALNTMWSGSLTSQQSICKRAIFVHGYNSIRLRFPATAPVTVGAGFRVPLAWRIYLIDSDVEPDQIESYWTSSIYCTITTQWAATPSIPTVPGPTNPDLFNKYCKTWMRFANAVKVVRGDAAIGELTEIAATSPTSSNYAYGYIGNTYAGAIGSYSSLQPHSIKSSDGLPNADIYSDAAVAPTYSPVYGAAPYTTQAGEMYINNLAGSQYLLCVPYQSWGYVPSVVKYTAPSVAQAGVARSVGMSYNLVQ